MRDETRRVETVWVPLTRVRIRERRLRGLSASTVDRYRLWLEQGREAPPVRLVRQGEWYLVRDGRHRVAAALAAGLTEIEAEVRRIVWAAAERLFSRRPLMSAIDSRGAAARAPRVHRGGLLVVGVCCPVKPPLSAGSRGLSSSRPRRARGAGRCARASRAARPGFGRR
jgi:hypothetical protein